MRGMLFLHVLECFYTVHIHMLVGVVLCILVQIDVCQCPIPMLWPISRGLGKSHARSELLCLG